jgi:hypothetical protein
MAEYVNAPIPQDPEEIEAEVVAYLQANVPGWQPAEGNLDYWIIRAFCQRAAVIGESVTDVLRGIFRYFGAKLAGIPPLEATTASGLTTWTVLPADLYRAIPEGEPIAFSGLDGEDVIFQTTAEAIIAPGQTEVTGVPVSALNPGAASSEIVGEGDMLGDLDYAVSVVLEGPTGGGQDAEPDDVYLDRLAEELALMSPRWIRAREAAVIAKRVAEVERALAIDNFDATGYNAATGTGGTDDVEGVMALCPINAAGDFVSTGGQTAVLEALIRTAGVNCDVHLIAPTYTNVAALFGITVWEDFDAAAVLANAEAAVEAYLSAAHWGQPDYGERRRWVPENIVRYLEVAQVIQSVEGVRYVDSLTLNGSEDDLSLPGRAAFPVGTATGSVTA